MITINGMTFYNADCMDIMKQYPDKYFSLAIVDPPYGIGAEKMKRGNAKIKPNKNKNWDSMPPNDLYFKELFRISKNQIVFAGNYFDQLSIYNPKLKLKIDFLKYEGIIWDKGETMYGRDFSECEIAWTNMESSIFKLSPNQNDRIHPTQKPVALYDWILNKYANSNDKILDTHLGSGSIAIAIDKANRLNNMNLEFVGIELDKEYFDLAMNRINNHCNQQTIFDL